MHRTAPPRSHCDLCGAATYERRLARRCLVAVSIVVLVVGALFRRAARRTFLDEARG